MKSKGTMTREDENPFKLSYSMGKDSDPSKLYFFFWAGNTEDQVAENGNINDNTVIFNFPNAYIQVNPNLLNKSITNGKFEDYYTGYFQFSETSSPESKTKTVILKRPFAEVHLLTDDFINTDLKNNYNNGVYSYCGLQTSDISEINLRTQNASLGYIDQWNYANKTYSYKWNIVVRNQPTQPFYYFNNIDQLNEKKIIYKNKEYHYLSLSYIFTPDLINDFSYFVNVMANDKNITSNYNIHSIPLPEEGIKPNTKYVIISSLYDKYEILVDEDNSWGETTDI